MERTVAKGIEQHNAMVRRRILAKIAAGHPTVKRVMGGVLHLALYYGPGICSSSFVPAPKAR